MKKNTYRLEGGITNSNWILVDSEGLSSQLKLGDGTLISIGANNGIPSLDSAGKVPISQLPNSIMEYKGNYNALTNNPSLIDGVGSAGDVWRVNVTGPGVNNLGYVVGDYVTYNGSTWEKSHAGADNILSVNGKSGIVVLDKTDIGLSNVPNIDFSNKFNTPTGSNLQYVAGDGSLILFPTFLSSDQLIANIYNGTGNVVPAFNVVYINGVHGNLPSLALAQANTESTSSKTYAVTSFSINNGNSGTVITDGKLKNVNTLSFTEGDQLWLSSTTTGGVTTIKPSAPNHAVFIGTVTRAHQTQGEVQIRIQNGFELDELHNVSITNKSNLDVIRYNSTTGLWENKQLDNYIPIEIVDTYSQISNTSVSKISIVKNDEVWGDTNTMYLKNNGILTKIITLQES